MASLHSYVANSYYYYYLPCLIILLLASLPHHTNAIVPRDNMCRTARNPAFCYKTLPGTGLNVRSYGRYLLHQSLSHSRNSLTYLNTYLQKYSHALPRQAVGALEDCRLLVSLNAELLSRCVYTANKTDALLSTLSADDFQNALSSVATNMDTCSEGLSLHPSVKDDIYGTGGLSYDTQLHSLSLDLCTRGWVPPSASGGPWTRRIPRVASWGTGRNVPLRFESEEKRKVYEAAVRRRRGRRLLGAGDEEVVVKDIVVVSKDGSWDFRNISAAVAAAPKNLNGSDGYFLIYCTAGVYEEYVDIPSNKMFLFLLGDGINQTIITGNHSVGDNFTTFNSATLAVTGQGFLAVDLTIRNTAGPSKNQAVALRNGADLSTFYRCSFEAFQDTLYAHSNRQFYRNCNVSGTVDFIFGNAATILQNCFLLPRLPNKGQFNAITAQGRTDPNQNTGTSIQNCTITAAPDLAASNGTTKTYLGRPWKEFSRTVVIQSFLDKLIQPVGWNQWNGSFALSTLYYAEFGNRGPGSNTSGRVTWPGFHLINATEALRFTVSPFLGGGNWLNLTGVPFFDGIM